VLVVRRHREEPGVVVAPVRAVLAVQGHRLPPGGRQQDGAPRCAVADGTDERKLEIMTNSGAGGRDPADGAVWADVDALIAEFRGRYEFTSSRYPEGRMIVAKPLPIDWSSKWIVRETAGEVREEIRRREAEAGKGKGEA
jgi:hypothetical protein